MGYPALPGSVDQYVRQMLDTMAGRTGRLGDKVVTYNDLAQSGLLIGNPNALNGQSNPSKGINDALTKPPVNEGGTVITPEIQPNEPPTNPKGLKTTGIFGAVILEWLPPDYIGHAYTEIYRAQIDDVSQSAMVHQAEGNSYADVVNHGTIHYYWIRHVNKDGLKSNYNQVAGTLGQATADPTVIQEAVQGVIDNSYFTPGWAAHTDQQEQKLSQAEQDLRSAEHSINVVNTDLSGVKTGLTNEVTERNDADNALTSSVNAVAANLSTETDNRVAAVQSEATARAGADNALGQRIDTVVADLSTETTERKSAITSVQQAQVDGDSALSQQITQLTAKVGDNESSITNLNQTTQTQAQTISQLETSDGLQSTKILTLEQTTASQATQLTQLSSTVDGNTSAINEQKTVTDGLKAEYTLKVTQEGADGKPIIAGIGVASGQNEDGETFSEIAMVAENFFFSSPKGLHSPFSIVDIGSGDYKISMNADVLINGSLNISQLESGELNQGTALTVGRSSIELSTASDGTGQLIIAGDGGIQNNDYMIMNAGRISAYVFVPGVGHVPYKEVKRVETGTANSGQQVKIPAYFRSQPTVHLYPRDMSVYNADYPNQSQKIEIYSSAPQPHPTEDGAWLFTPYAKLVLSSGTEVVSPGWTYAGTSNSQEWTATNIGNLQSVTVDCRCASFRRTAGTTYQNRQVTVYLDYKLSSSSTWSVGSSEVVSIEQFTTHAVQLTKALTQNQYDIRVRYVAADRSGSFNDGNPTYEYTQQGKTGTPWAKTTEPTGGARTETQFITIDNHALSGWEITRIDYNVIADIVLKVRNLYSNNNSSGSIFKGKARVKVPDGNGSHSTYEVTTQSDYIETGNPWEQYGANDIAIQWSDTSYKDGKIYPAVELYGNKAGYTRKSSSASYISSSHAYINVKSISATVYYRRQQSNPQTYNTYYMDSARYDKSATDISLDNAVVAWMATSDN